MLSLHPTLEDAAACPTNLTLFLVDLDIPSLNPPSQHLPQITADQTCAAELGEPLQHIYNLSLQLGRVPSMWKTLCIGPVPRKSRPGELNDYRPVALTSQLMKTLEWLFLKAPQASGATGSRPPAVCLPSSWCLEGCSHPRLKPEPSVLPTETGILQHLQEAPVDVLPATTLFYAVVGWGVNLTKRSANRLDKLISARVISGAMLSGAFAPGRVSQGRQVLSDEPASRIASCGTNAGKSLLWYQRHE
ncbi:uncharacterized protein LOC112150283 [Oryzias melastigma]|uniref:uncharacterized protein LOC112150283 n=1 Tax=Oryzias melastigma TaxID=30732 RepID=UPI000CF7D8B2|nr:uncharacterized protein LOC112150283 [Oryzias melastigma]